MIIKTIGLHEFRDAFTNSQHCNNFSYEGLEQLFYILDDTEENVELDVYAISCGYSEYTEKELIDYFGYEDYDDINSVLRELENDTEYYPLGNGSYLVQNL